MKDLIVSTGLSRETIHFYISQGLVPAGRKTSRTTSDYTEEHVKRLLWIRRLREEQFLPLWAVKALLGVEPDENLTGSQRRFLQRVRTALAESLNELEELPLASVEKGPLTKEDLKVLEENRLIEIKQVGRQAIVSTDDAEIIELFARLREAGFTRERGYTGAEMVVFDRAMEELVEKEFQLALKRLESQPIEVLRTIAAKANPFIEQLMIVMRRKKIRLGQNSGVFTSNRDADPDSEE